MHICNNVYLSICISENTHYCLEYALLRICIIESIHYCDPDSSGS